MLFASIAAQNTKELTCTFATQSWTVITAKLNLYTCKLYNQSIYDYGFTITSTSKTTTKGFSIANQKNVRFLPTNYGEKFPLLNALNIFNCSLQKIHSNAFENLYKLKLINLGKNEIATIEENAFAHQFKLESLILEYNNMEFISSNLFNSLESLINLSLGENRIEMLSPKTFRNLKNLENLKLRNNKIQYLHEDLFSTLLNLKDLNLRNNKVDVINPKLFDRNSNMVNLWLDDNNIKFIKPNTFQNVTALEFVGLGFNDCINADFKVPYLIDLEKFLEKNCLPVEDLLTKKINAAHETLKTVRDSEKNLVEKLKMREMKLQTEILRSRELEKKLTECMKEQV